MRIDANVNRMTAPRRSGPCADPIPNVRAPFVLTYHGRGNRERRLIATSQEVNGRCITLICREPVPPFQAVRLRPDLDGDEIDWLSGVATESVQSVGSYLVHVECDERRCA